MTALYIDTPEQLDALCRQLNRHDWLTLDTEFLREKTYRPRLCLLQVANPDVVACVDPLALEDLSPLLDVLYNPAITKVLHAAHQDLEIFFEMRGEVPTPIFDTQIAATLLGHGEQIGYGNLVKIELGIELEKAHARADWCRRPLETALLEYAADDVRHLREVYLRQRNTLAELGREQWLQPDFDELTDPSRYSNPPEQAWRRLKGGNRLKGVQLAVLQALAAWREERAQQSDRPRRWIIKDDILLDLAKQMPQELSKLKRIRGLEDATVQRHGETLLQIIAEARKRPKEQWPKPKAGKRLPLEQEPLVDAMMALLRERCRQQNISPGAVAGRRELEQLLMGEKETPLLHGWRAAIAGNALQQLLAGELALLVENGRLDIIPRE
ncbi:MAG: ribonuclease D [Pseudomonadota bacterium]